MTDAPKYTIQPAVKAQALLRMALYGPSGSGKTMSALRIASALSDRVGVIDSEHGTSAKYADRWRFDLITLTTRDTPDYLEAIALFAEAKYPVLILDSISHQWESILAFVDRLGVTKFRGNKFAAWSEATPLHQSFLEAIASYPGHVIVTMRSRTAWATQEGSKGVAPVRIGLEPKQREGMEYEYDLLMELTPENQASVIKDRTGRFTGLVLDQVTEGFGREMLAWLNEGDAPPVLPPRPQADTLPPAGAGGPPRLSPGKARALADRLIAAGADPLPFASGVLARSVPALTDLTTKDARLVFEALEARPTTEVAGAAASVAEAELEAASDEMIAEIEAQADPPEPPDGGGGGAVQPSAFETPAGPQPAEAPAAGESVAVTGAPPTPGELDQIRTRLARLGVPASMSAAVLSALLDRAVPTSLTLTAVEAETLLGMTDDALAVAIDVTRAA